MIEAQRTTRCLLCSLACRVAFDVGPEDGRDEVLTEYVAGDPVTQGRLCFRGHYLADMATHPFRVTGAARREGDALRPAEMTKVIPAVASRLREAGTRAAVVVDGNLPTEDIVAALRFARDVVGTDLLSVYLPDGDAEALRGISPRTPLLALADAGGRDAMLVIGDAFATHPVLSRPVLEARAARKLRLFGMDCMPNRVAGFAESFLRVVPGGEAAALAGLCMLMGRPLPEDAAWATGRSIADLARMAGVGESDLRLVGKALAAAQRPAVVFDPVPGRMTGVAAAAGMASALCGDGAVLLPLFQYGNAVGAGRAAVSFRALSLDDVLDAANRVKVSALLVIGVDLYAVLGARAAGDVLRNVPTVAVASAFRSRTTEVASVVLPLAAPFEVSGSLVDASGTRCQLEALLRPPGAAMNVREICRRLAFALDVWLPENGTATLESAFRGCASPAPEPADRSAQGLRLVARADSVDLPAGAVSRFLAWPRHCEPVPILQLNPADVRARGLAPRSRVRVRANGNEAVAELQASAGVPRGMAAVSTAFDETKPLFPRRAYGDGVSELCWSEAEVAAETE